MKNLTGLKLHESVDINIDGSHTMKAHHEISKIAIDEELVGAFKMNVNRKRSHNEAWDMALQEQR